MLINNSDVVQAKMLRPRLRPQPTTLKVNAEVCTFEANAGGRGQGL